MIIYDLSFNTLYIAENLILDLKLSNLIRYSQKESEKQLPQKIES
mgnify:CR=1 FL=1